MPTFLTNLLKRFRGPVAGISGLPQQGVASQNFQVAGQTLRPTAPAPAAIPIGQQFAQQIASLPQEQFLRGLGRQPTIQGQIKAGPPAPTGIVSPTQATTPPPPTAALGGTPPVVGGISPEMQGLASTLGITGTPQEQAAALRQALGLEESPEQKTQREALQTSLQQLVTLQSELAKARAPQSTITELDKAITEQQQALKNLTPEKFLQTQRGLLDVGISQTQLQREVAARREPIAGALSDLIMSRSVLAQQQQAQIEGVQSQIEAARSQAEIQQAIADLVPKKQLPAAIQTEIFKRALPKTEEEKLEARLKEAQISKTEADIQKIQNDISSGVLNDAEIARIDRSPEGKKLQTLNDLKRSAQKYLNLIEEYGYQAAGIGRTLIESAYADFKIKQKEADNLGALTGPDVAILSERVKPLTGLAGAGAALIGGGSAGVIEGVRQIIRNVEEEGRDKFESLKRRNPKYGASEYVQGLGSAFVTLNVRRLSDGTEGTIEEDEFDPDLYELVE